MILYAFIYALYQDKYHYNTLFMRYLYNMTKADS